MATFKLNYIYIC